MDLAGRLQQLEEMVREAKSMPLSSSALLNRDEVLDNITLTWVTNTGMSSGSSAVTSTSDPNTFPRSVHCA